MKTYINIGKITRYCIAALFGAALLMSCEKENEVKDPNFDVQTQSLTYKVGEEVTFNMTGDPDFISFYSGKQGNSYDYVGKDRTFPATISLSFGTRLESGNQLKNIIRVLYSTDFVPEVNENNTIKPESVSAATWNDITAQFAIPDAINTETTPSGVLDVTTLFGDGTKPVYFAYKYNIAAYDVITNPNERTAVYIYDFFVKTVSDITSSDIVNVSTAGWKFAYTKGYEEETAFCDVSTSRVRMYSSFTPTTDREAWAISAPITAEPVLNLGPDWADGIKAVSEPQLSFYRYIYDTPGTYTATFVAANANISGRKEVVKHVKLNIVEDGGSIVPPTPDPWN